MSKLKTTNGWYLNRRKVQLFSDGAEKLFLEDENSRVHIIGVHKFLEVHRGTQRQFLGKISVRKTI